MAIKFQWMADKNLRASPTATSSTPFRAPWYYPQKRRETKDSRISEFVCRVVVLLKVMIRNIQKSCWKQPPKRIILQYPSGKKRKESAQGEQRRLTALRITGCKKEGFGCAFSQGSFVSPVPTDLRSHDSQREHIWHHITNPQ